MLYCIILCYIMLYDRWEEARDPRGALVVHGAADDPVRGAGDLAPPTADREPPLNK